MSEKLGIIYLSFFEVLLALSMLRSYGLLFEYGKTQFCILTKFSISTATLFGLGLFLGF